MNKAMKVPRRGRLSPSICNPRAEMLRIVAGIEMLAIFNVERAAHLDARHAAPLDRLADERRG